jgi:hypothetical protein
MPGNPFDEFDNAQPQTDVAAPQNPFDTFDGGAAEKPSTFLERQAPVKSTSQEAVKGIGAIAKGFEAAAYVTPPGVGGETPTESDIAEFNRRISLTPSQRLAEIHHGSAYQFGKSIQEVAEEAYPLSEEEKKGLTTKIGKAIGGFLPMAATGPAAPATIGFQAIGEGLDNNYQSEIAKGKTPDQAAESAINRSLVSGTVQAAIFAFLPAPLRKAGDKALIDKFARGILSRFLLKRAAQASEGAVLGATSKVSENVIEGEPVTKDVASSAAGLGAMQTFFPRAATPDEQLFKAPPENYFDTPEIAHQSNLPTPRGGSPAPVNPYVPPEPGPLGAIPEGGTVPVPSRRRIILPSDQLLKGAPNAIPIGSTTPVPVEDQTKNSGSVEPRAVVQNGAEGIPAEKQGTAVPQEEKGQETPSNLPDVIRAKLLANMQGREMILQPGAFDTADAHLKLVLGKDAPTWKELAASGVVNATPTEDGGTVVKVKLQEAPVTFQGVQKGLPAKGIPDIQLFNLTEAIPGYGKGSTVGRAELERQGYTIPAGEDPTLKRADQTETRPSQLKFPPVEVPASEIAARPELMQFKEIGDTTTGENEGEKLAGKWDESKAGLLMLWEPKDPAKYGLKPGQKYIVGNGHHRFGFGEREKVPAYGSQIFREADGYSAEDVRRIAAEANIADGKGTIYDQVKYLRNSPSTRTADARLEAARRIGNRGSKAINIAFNAGDDLYASFVNEKITPEQAEAISVASPSNVAAQRVGIKFALEGKSPDFLTAVVRRALQETGGKSQELDLFGNDDSLMKSMAEDEAKAEEIRSGLREQIRSVQGAARNPKLARKLGVDVKDPQGVVKRIDALKSELARWENWFLSGNEDLQKQIRGKAIEKVSGQQPITDQGSRSGEAERPAVDVTNKGAETLAKPADLEKIPQATENYEIALKGEKDPLGFGFSHGKFYLSPDLRWISVEEHEDAARELLGNEGVKASERDLNPNQAILEQKKRFVRVIDEEGRIYFSTEPTPSQLDELIRVAKEYKYELVKEDNAAPGGERVIYTPEGKPKSIAPWEQTFEEYKKTSGIPKVAAEKIHRESVDDAIAQGKSVRPEVISDYPDLRKIYFGGEEKPALKLQQPETVEAQKTRIAEENKKRAAEAEKQKLADAAAKPLVGTVGDIGQRSLIPGEEDLFSAAPAKPAAEEKPVEPKTEPQAKAIAEDQKFRVGKNPQIYSLVERLAQSESEKELGEQPVRVKNDKTGEVQVVLEQDLTPVKLRTEDERAASKALTTKELDDLIRKEGLDPKEFPTKADKREILKRQGKLSKREIAEGIAEKLEEKKIKGKPDELFTAILPGLDPVSLRALWNTAIDVAQNFIRAGGSLADGIERAIEYLRANVAGKWDEAAVRRELETSIGPVGENERHQVAGVRKLGSEYEPETIRAIQSRLRVGYFDSTQPVEAARTETAWDIANRLTDQRGRAAYAEDVANNGGGNMAPGLLVKELWDYAVKMAAGKDDSLLRFIVNRYADFETVSGGGSTSKAGQVLRSARELAQNPLWQALVRMEKESAAMADRRLAVGPELLNDIISRVNEINLSPAEVENVLNEGRDSQGRTLQEILDENSPERAAARDALQQYSPQVKTTALETVYEWLKQNTQTDEKTFVDSLTKALVDLNNVDLDEATARQIAEGTWTRKNTVETNRRRAAWDRVLKEMDERAQRTAQSFLNRLETSQTEWQQTPERKNEALNIIREALDPKTPLPAQEPSLFKNPLRDRLMALGVSRETATRLVNEIYEKRISEWATARAKAMEAASASGSIKSLVEALRSNPYRAQKDPAWRQRTSEDWFMSNGLSRDQAVTASKLFSEQFEKALQTAGEKLATQLLDGKPPRTIADVIKAIRAGLTDPSRNWVEDIAALNGWKTLTPEQHAQLADLDEKLSDPELSLPEQSELFDKMNSIVQRAGDGSKRWKYAIGELFAANKLSGLKTLTLHLFQPITASLIRDFPTAAIFQTKDLPTIARAYVEAAKNFFPELKYAWQKDVYYLSQSKMISYHNELRNQFEDGIKSLKAGDYKGALKLTYAWAQYFLRALQSANQANQAIIREWKLALYGSQAMRDAGMGTAEIERIVDTIVNLKTSAYEEGLSRGMSKSAAYVRADDVAFQAMRRYFNETVPGDTNPIGDNIIRSAENDQYSTVGRLSPENTGKEEGWASEFVNKLILRPASELRKDGGFKSVLGMTVFGFVSIPLRVARYLSNFSPYGFVRYGRFKLGQARNWENPWTQSYATNLQAQQRLREAIVGTAGGLLALGLFHTTADPDRDKRKFGVYVSGAWKGINSRVERDALDKLGFKPLSLHVVVDGKVRTSIPMTRTGHALGYLLGLSAMADDIAWRQKEAAISGSEVPLSTDAVSALGTLYYIVGQQGFLQSVSHFQSVAQGTSGGAAIEKSIADAASSAVGGFIPGQVFLQNMTELVKGPLDKSSIQSDVAANFPVVGAMWQKQAINRLGDPLYDQTWYGKSLRLGAPIAFKVAQNKENEQIYGMMVDKGVAPPDLRRSIIEDKYGPLTDDQWSKFSKLSGDLLKQQIIGNLASLQSQDPADVKKFFNKSSTSANNDAAGANGLEAQPNPSKTTVVPSGAISTPVRASGRAAGPAALRGLPKSTGAKRLRRIGLRASSGVARNLQSSKLSSGKRHSASLRRRVAGARIASGYSNRFRQRRIVAV